MKLKLFYSLKRKVLAVCLAGMILMALCVGGISLWTISHLTYDYEIQNMNHLVTRRRRSSTMSCCAQKTS